MLFVLNENRKKKVVLMNLPPFRKWREFFHGKNKMSVVLLSFQVFFFIYMFKSRG